MKFFRRGQICVCLRNEMHQQMNDVKRQQAQTARELEEVTAKLDKFLYMLEEVQNLPD